MIFIYSEGKVNTAGRKPNTVPVWLELLYMFTLPIIVASY